MNVPERRRFFRINDVVGLSYQPVTPAMTQQATAREAENLQISGIDLWRSVDRELLAALESLWKTNEVVAQALGLLNRKLDILAAENRVDSAAELSPAQPQQVNISACGIAFEGPESFSVGQTLALDIVLKPASKPIKLTGRVVECEKLEDAEGFRYLLRIDFNPIATDLHEQLIQHIVQRQSSQLGKQRVEQDP